MRFDYNDSTSHHQPLYQRCKDLDLISWLRTEPPVERIKECRDRRGDTRLFRPLGRVSSLILRDDCTLCRCRYGLITLTGTDKDQEIELVLTCLTYITNVLPGDPLAMDYQITRVGEGLCISEPSADVPSGALRMKEIDPRSHDVSGIRRWLSNCEKLYSNTCPVLRSESIGTILLIDAQSRRIVPYSSRTNRYLALSDNDQTSEASKLQQIGIMGDIYHGAYATIIALDGETADSGLARMGQKTVPYQQLRCCINGTQLLSLGPFLETIVSQFPWSKRSWTYQEAILSPRCIFISRYPTYFACNISMCCETLDDSRLVNRSPEEGHTDDWDISLLDFRNPSRSDSQNAFSRYVMYATEYTARSLTNQSDGLHAFFGILQALEKTIYTRGTLWALPCEDLDLALCWSTHPGRLRNEAFPTWSWLS
ncbi:MAG: hypothetical protein Q9219_007650 [cf. Caloplaca sp. 3 TL-2023]